jgi:hypothetical protein
MRIPLLQGRDFSRTDYSQTQKTAIVSHSLATRLFPHGSALGKHIQFGTEPETRDLEIIGVTTDARLEEIRTDDLSFVYFNFWQHPKSGNWGNLQVRYAGLTGEITSAIRAELKKAGRQYALSLRPISEQRDYSLIREKLMATLGTVFAGLALTLAALGLFGLLSFLVTSRTGEIGIRIAVGAERGALRWLILREALLLVGVGLAVGLSYLLRWRAGTLQLVRDFDPTITNPATSTLGAMWFGGQNGRTNLENTLYNIFLPRIGFAWSPKSNWVFRGGFGIYDGPWSLDTYAGGAEGLGTNSHGSLTSTDQINPVFLLSQATYANLNYVGPNRAPDSFNGQTPPYYPRNTPILKQYQWSFSIQHQFGGGMMAEAAYVGNHGTNLSFPADTNQVPVGLLLQSVADPANAQNLRPFPQFSSINGNPYNAISNYDALQLSLAKRFSHGLQFNVNYTWSKMLDEQDSSGWGSRAGNQLYQDAYNPRLNYALSNFDIPNMFKGDLVYDLPFGKGRAFLNNNGFVDAVLGGWQIGTTFVFESGFPFNPVVGATNQSGTLSGGSSTASLYPDLIGNPNVSNQSIGQWFNTCTTLLDGTNFPVGCSNPAWAVPAPGHFGTAGRNILRGPGIQDVDFSLGKNFRFPLPHETGNLQIRFDALNGLNHPNFDLPGNSVGTSGAGIITATTGNYNTTNNSFAQRTLQLGARFSF